MRIAQLDIVVTGSKREFLGLLDLVCKAAIDVDRGVLAIRLDLDVSKIRGHVVGLIRVRIRVGEKWVETRIGSTTTTRCCTGCCAIGAGCGAGAGVDFCATAIELTSNPPSIKDVSIFQNARIVPPFSLAGLPA